MNEAKQCPWCSRWALKDGACSYVFACGLDEHNAFHIGNGCGKTWCWTCGRKYCGQYIDVTTGERLSTAKDMHDSICCAADSGFVQDEYCPGGHNPHCAVRFTTNT